MSGFRFSFPACVIAGKGRITADDVLMLRKYTLPEGVRSFEDTLVLFALNESCGTPNLEWTTYFVESLAGFLVHGTEPAGMIDDDKARWLIRNISVDGIVYDAPSLELLLHAMELAYEVPETLSAFALDQISMALRPRANGAYHETRPLAPGVTAHDLAYIWRVLCGALDPGRLILSPPETLALKNIDDCAPASDHHPAWREMMATILTLDRPRTALRTAPWLITDDRDVLDEEAAA